MADFAARPPADSPSEPARLFERLGYGALALCAPVAAVISSVAVLALYVVGAAMLLISAALDPERSIAQRWRDVARSPLMGAGLALMAWAAVSLAWTPFPEAGVQQLVSLGLIGFGAALAMTSGREHMRASDLYIFPGGVALALIVVALLALAQNWGFDAPTGYFGRCGEALAIMLYPAMAGLAARGRNGLARLLQILALGFAFALGEPAVATALLAGFTALSFALSDLPRTARDFGLLAAAIILLAPLAPALAPGAAHWIFHAKLAAASDPFAPLAEAARTVLHEPGRLLTGRGIGTIAQGVLNGALPAATPRVALYQLWYELGVVGAALAALCAWLAFRALAQAGAKVAPYLAAALTCDLALAFLKQDFASLWWVATLAVSAIAAAAASRSQYRTTRPSAAGLAHL